MQILHDDQKMDAKGPELRDPTGSRPLSEGAGSPARGEQARSAAHGQFHERYWARLFDITQADLTRLSGMIRASGDAYDLTSLARDTIRARLEGGPQLESGPALDAGMPAHAVRGWDPSAAWSVGDRAIILVPKPGPARAYAPRVAEIRRVGEDHAILQVDGISAPQVYALGLDGKIGQSVTPEAEIASLAQRQDKDAQIDYVLWRFGDRVVGRLLHALDTDDRFVELEGLWFLRDLARRPGELQLVDLARAMFTAADGPHSISDLLTLLPALQQRDTPGRFGLALAMQARSDLFLCVGSPAHPRWVLAGPPPMRLVAQCAVYDPETYNVLCAPGESLGPDVARRLWDAGLLRVALEPTHDEEADSSSSRGPDRRERKRRVTDELLPPKPASRDDEDARTISWPRWLPFGRQ